MTLACEDTNSKIVDVIIVGDEDRVGNSLLQIWELRIEQKFSFMTKPQLLNLQQTLANMIIIIINIGNSNSHNKFWVGIFTPKGHINQVY